MMITIGPKFCPIPSSLSPHPLVHVKVKVTVMSKFYIKILCQSFRSSLLLNKTIDLIYMWYHDIYWSKVSTSNISTYDLNLRAEVTYLKNLKFWFDENFAQCNHHCLPTPPPPPSTHTYTHTQVMSKSRSRT